MGKLSLNRSQKIGLFVLVALVALYAVIKFLKGEDLFNSRRSFYAIAESVEGLTPSSPVYVRGLKVGNIEKISYNAKSDSFTILFNIKSEYTIASNSIAEIYSSDILGSKSLRIAMGNSPVAAVADDTLECRVLPDMISVISREIVPIKEQVSELLGNMNTTFANINALLTPEAKREIASSLAALESSLENLESISGNINNLTPEIAEILGNIDTLSAGLRRSSPQLESLISNMERVSSGLASAELDQTITSIRELVEKLQNPDGSVGKLLSTDSLHNSVVSLINSLNDFVEKMSENPKKFIKISVF